MANYIVTDPQGAKYKITAPDDATPEQIGTYFKQQQAQGIPDNGQRTDDAIQQARMRSILGAASPFGEYTPEVAKGVTALPRAIAQGVAHAVDFVRPETGAVDLYQRADAGMNSMKDNLVGKPPSPLAGAVAEGAGEMLLPGAMLGKVAPAASALGRVVQSGAGGAAAAVGTPTNEGGDFMMDKVKQALIGLLTGAAGGAVGEGLAKTGNKITPDAQMMLDNGITPRPGQMLGGGFKQAEEKMESFPLAGDIIKAAGNRGNREFNIALYNRTLAPIGETFPANIDPGRAGVAYVGDKLSDAYKAVLPTFGVNKDQAFQQAQMQLSQMAMNMPAERANQFMNIVRNEIDSKFTPAGLMSGETMKGVESKLGSLARSYSGTGNGDEQLLANAIRQAQENVRDMVVRQDPQAAKAVQAINDGWANLTQLETAAARLSSKNGMVSAANYSSAVKQGDKTIRDRAYARGDALNEGFSDAAKNVLSPEVADSGSPGRILMAALGHGGFDAVRGIPAATIAALAYSPAGQKAIAALLTANPEAFKALGSLSPLLAAPAASSLTQR